LLPEVGFVNQQGLRQKLKTQKIVANAPQICDVRDFEIENCPPLQT